MTRKTAAILGLTACLLCLGFLGPDAVSVAAAPSGGMHRVSVTRYTFKDGQPGIQVTYKHQIGEENERWVVVSSQELRQIAAFETVLARAWRQKDPTRLHEPEKGGPPYSEWPAYKDCTPGRLQDSFEFIDGIPGVQHWVQLLFTVDEADVTEAIKLAKSGGVTLRKESR